MQIIKLNQRYVLGKAGFTHAVHYRRRHRNMSVERALTKMYGEGWSRWRPTPDLAWGYYISPKSGEYFVGVQNLADLTAALLMVDHV